ncbi:MAG TPA: transcription elongation factor GreB [Steroidobacteraceae bacterium]|jgi:transcription elongation factor GreB|nr:transcription elongation factor GreB [Steroidobacteraceae bacterium]
MTRYRPPQPKGSKFITKSGWQRLKDELDYLWKVKRPQVTQAVSEAAAQGDRSENAEYIYGKKQLREIDSRVRFLRQRLDGMVIVNQVPSDLSRVFFGAWVTLEDEAGVELEYRIVGPDEFDATQKLISMDSPLAKALFKKTLDDEISIEVPGGKKSYVIVAISYRDFETV